VVPASRHRPTAIIRNLGDSPRAPTADADHAIPQSAGSAELEFDFFAAKTNTTNHANYPTYPGPGPDLGKQG
jgi:hypothetical protein